MAKNLGVSKSTVSRALSGKGRIGETTRIKIRSYAQKHGKWQGDKQAAEHSKTKNIAVVIPTDAYTTSIPFFYECLLGVSEVASMLKYSVLITIGAPGDISGIQALVEKNEVDGLILLRNIEDDKLLKYLVENHFPTGLAGTCNYEEVIQVDIDNRAASESLVSLLIGQGYRRFATVVGDSAYHVNRCRCQGCYDAFDKHGLPREQQMFYPNFVNMELIDSIISDMFARKIECIMCGDDVICTRIMSRLQAEGYRIPRDISIASLHNSTNLDCFSPAVTSINVSGRQVGNMVSKQLINRLKGEAYNAKTNPGYEILLRKSIGKMYSV
ncbi:LacI family DNA-binding transcriptional regulator [Anaerocolumna sedimenticola]|uniref:LacI family DNA-binding transcriptional regulator n=1 Tax=Anaerocolumna sedimenticola TaxID=2696063 RepID=UPI0038BBF5E0